MKATIVIEITHVASAEPSVVREDLVSFVGKIPVAAEDIRPARSNFADLVSIDALFFFKRARVDPNLHAGNWLPCAVRSRFVRQLHGQKR